MTHIEEATLTCKYALSYGLTALNEHFDLWLDGSLPFADEDESLYAAALSEIESKLGTPECLLK